MPLSEARQNNALVVMARYPTSGQVKTRLAEQLGQEAAARLYAAFLRDLDTRLGDARRPWTLHWAYAPAESAFRALVGAGPCLPQRGADLGERLGNAFEDVWREGFRRVVVVGSDSPHVDLEWIGEAFCLLGESDVVLGPAEDGGYYLVGLREPHDLFTAMPWSTDAVLRRTLARAERLGLSTQMLPPTFDVDTTADLAKLTAWLRASPAPDDLPHTRRALASLVRQVPATETI